ncbi:hypothetical protein ACRALDRAFT_1074328 [Sodiomyces alcalophilus JCM 7366]|uniref:uncharacterized protein n=1 Tax=Sodiomyces alcalophilus JCM 7366 TaxID=591952 RepID=UPI0039B581AF
MAFSCPSSRNIDGSMTSDLGACPRTYAMVVTVHENNRCAGYKPDCTPGLTTRRQRREAEDVAKDMK